MSCNIERNDHPGPGSGHQKYACCSKQIYVTFMHNMFLKIISSACYAVSTDIMDFVERKDWYGDGSGSGVLSLKWQYNFSGEKDHWHDSDNEENARIYFVSLYSTL